MKGRLRYPSGLIVHSGLSYFNVCSREVMLSLYASALLSELE